MRLKHTLALGFVLAVPVFLNPWRLDASDGILSRLHHHGDCDAKQTVVRLPAQEIRVETTRPNIVVNERSSHGSGRVRGFMPHAPAFMPTVSGPFVATFLPMHGGLTFGGGGNAGSPALDALHALEHQHLQFAKHQAGLKTEMEITNQAALRVSEKLSSTLKSSGGSTADTSDLQSKLADINRRLDGIERLLIIHDDLLKKANPK